MLQPVAESWGTTLRRNGVLALAIGAGAGLSDRRLAVVAPVTLVALWFTIGGHFVELLFRNRLGPRIGGSREGLAVTRLVYWFIGGSVLFAAALATRRLLTGPAPTLWPWWAGGALFVGAELGVHLLLRARGQPSFYDGRG